MFKKISASVKVRHFVKSFFNFAYDALHTIVVITIIVIFRFVNILNSTHQTVAVFFLLLIGATLSLIGIRVSTKYLFLNNIHRRKQK